MKTCEQCRYWYKIAGKADVNGKDMDAGWCTRNPVQLAVGKRRGYPVVVAEQVSCGEFRGRGFWGWLKGVFGG